MRIENGFFPEFKKISLSPLNFGAGPVISNFPDIAVTPKRPAPVVPTTILASASAACSPPALICALKDGKSGAAGDLLTPSMNIFEGVLKNGRMSLKEGCLDLNVSMD